METTTLGGGCFWCLEAVYDQLEGVTDVRSGYMGGKNANPSYEEVCSGTTGHAEVVQVTFDPAVISFDEILEVFFTIHDPTTLNRQGADVGTQYRSVIFTHSAAQADAAARAIKAHSADFKDAIVTEVTPASVFYEAEAYHQEYYANNSAQPYCAFVVGPKVAKFRKRYPERVKASA